MLMKIKILILKRQIPRHSNPYISQTDFYIFGDQNMIE